MRAESDAASRLYPDAVGSAPLSKGEGSRARAEAGTTRRGNRGSPWAAIESVADFLGSPDPDGDFLEPRMLARGSLTIFFSPRGLGKTHLAHAVAVKLARQGRRVLIIDRDNSRRELKRRLRGWGADGLLNLKILGRDDAPSLTDRQAWADFPIKDYDLVVIDSFDSSTEGIGEQDSAKPSLALAPLLDIVHTATGPAVLVLGNTVKSGSHGRGSGVIEDRADIVFEVRDATDLRPSGAKPWWLELPTADRGSWAERAARRKKRDTYRLAFIPSKFRIGEEPDPFVLEIRLNADQWTLEGVTEGLVAAGEETRTREASEQGERIDRAAAQLAANVATRAASGAPLKKREDAEPFLMALGLSRRAARGLIADRAGKDWRLSGNGSRAHPKVLLPPGGGTSVEKTAGMPGAAHPRQMHLSNTAIVAEQDSRGRPESASVKTATDAPENNHSFRPSGLPKEDKREADRLTHAPATACPDCGARLLRWSFAYVCTACRHQFPDQARANSTNAADGRELVRASRA